eukprot:TRINITY_DN123331_c0_g1_i1.p1 TRINITY_DN123331_c0_g1~~TRINITY_DN123331_c0_g1_i1.p1  ORF type:complete len:263 (-),score=9.01 TRINITY_DN123331_c0_g1_i1:8-796(-)
MAHHAALCSERFAARGVLHVRGLVLPPLLQRVNTLMRSRAHRVMTALGSKPIGIGSKDGYHELVQRSPNRFDVPLSEADTVALWSEDRKPPWMEFVRDVLGPDAKQSFAGVVFSKPGSPAQQWHIDSPHEGEEHRPAHALNVLLALSDIAVAAGPTEVAAGSHVLTNHLKRPWLDRDDMLYQTANEVTPQCLQNSASDSELIDYRVRALAAGDCVIFDDRILHRGLANCSDEDRWVAYFSYMRPRPGTIEDTHFEATRTLFP